MLPSANRFLWKGEQFFGWSSEEGNTGRQKSDWQRMQVTYGWQIPTAEVDHELLGICFCADYNGHCAATRRL